jgi:hypothetical protein
MVLGRTLLLLLFLPSLSFAKAPGELDANWTATLDQGSKGYGLVVAAKQDDKEPADWTEPNLNGRFAIGFDAENPKVENIFNEFGNIYGRPEREVSLHLNGREIANRVSPMPLSGAKYELQIKRVVGGSEVTVRIGGEPVYDRYFVPELKLIEGIPKFGGQAKVEGFKARTRGNADESVPTRVTAFDKATNDIDHHRTSALVEFPKETKRIGRVICTLRLEKTLKGIDPWDRFAAIYLFDDRGERFEILRYITPYRKEWEWKMDVTDYLPLLTGTKRMEQFCETYGPGWLVTVTFDFYKGPLKRVPYKVENLWSTSALLGQKAHPLSEYLPDREVSIDAKARQVKARICVSGHGMDPNAKNAAEFFPLWRVLHVGGIQFRNTLWKEDNYLNPCRPQGGTWKFDRAGWAPGDIVSPWVVDLTKAVKPGQVSKFRYEIEPYENPTPADGNPARHIIEAQMISYR